MSVKTTTKKIKKKWDTYLSKPSIPKMYYSLPTLLSFTIFGVLVYINICHKQTDCTSVGYALNLGSFLFASFYMFYGALNSICKEDMTESNGHKFVSIVVKPAIYTLLLSTASAFAFYVCLTCPMTSIINCLSVFCMCVTVPVIIWTSFLSSRENKKGKPISAVSIIIRFTIRCGILILIFVGSVVYFHCNRGVYPTSYQEIIDRTIFLFVSIPLSIGIPFGVSRYLNDRKYGESVAKSLSTVISFVIGLSVTAFDLIHIVLSLGLVFTMFTLPVTATFIISLLGVFVLSKYMERQDKITSKQTNLSSQDTNKTT